MIFLRKILFPFSILYGLITQFRNFLYDIGVFKSYKFNFPVIVVGNLSVGGTGKTPLIEYLVRLLSDNYKVATLSRGYKRKTHGFILADATSNAQILGDEPFQIHQKFPEVLVAVDANRKNGIEKLLSLPVQPDVILLDDAFQHRRVNAGFYILLTAYTDLFCDDFIVPAGNLRESRNGVARAQVIIITKCPRDLSVTDREKIINRIGSDKPVFFSYIDYDEKVYNETNALTVNELKNTNKLLLAGIAKPKPFFEYLKNNKDLQLTFPDHHHFTDNDVLNIKSQANTRLIITTEKDYVRLKGRIDSNQLYFLPIKTGFISTGDAFNSEILDYVATVIDKKIMIHK